MTLQMQFDGYRVVILKAVAPHLSNKRVKAVYEVSLKIKDSKYRVEALISMLPYLFNNRKEKALRFSLTAAITLAIPRFYSMDTKIVSEIGLQRLPD